MLESLLYAFFFKFFLLLLFPVCLFFEDFACSVVADSEHFLGFLFLFFGLVSAHCTISLSEPL
jgi:hypothetical protein